MYRLNLPKSFTVVKRKSFLFLGGSLNTWLCVPLYSCLRFSSKRILLLLNASSKLPVHQRTLRKSFYSSLHSKVKLLSLGFSRTLILDGVGFRVVLESNRVLLFLGFSAPVPIRVPNSLRLQILSKTAVKIFGSQRSLVNNFALKIYRLRPPDAYKGKGVLFSGQTSVLKPQTK